MNALKPTDLIHDLPSDFARHDPLAEGHILGIEVRHILNNMIWFIPCVLFDKLFKNILAVFTF